MSTTLITGANRGIGLELARQCAARGDTVIAVCRRPSAELEKLGVRIESGVDVTSDEDVAGLAQRLAYTDIHLLINNAGLLKRIGLENLDFDEIRRQFEVNALGPLRVTAALLPRLGEGAKIALITSRMGSIDDNTSGSHYAYRMSKAALNMAGASLAYDLRERGIAVAILHPGYVRTDMTEGRGFIDADESAAGLLARIEELSLETTGGFWHANGERLPW
jgi:NAD(P)-dependent dehydrogenase (short-subunit alcohol dehydrogenase family)